MTDLNEYFRLLKNDFKLVQDKEIAVKQQAYLKDQFIFLGIPKPLRAQVEKPYIKESKTYSVKEIMQLIELLHMQVEREFMYTAQQIALANVKRFTFADIIALSKFYTINPWWENVDGYNITIKRWLKLNPEYIREYIDYFKNSTNIWEIRASLICQLGLKEKLDIVYLQELTKMHKYNNEFFVYKAIAWILRDYAHFDPSFVKDYVLREKFTPFITKEALKNIG